MRFAAAGSILAFLLLLCPVPASAATTGLFGPTNPIVPAECQCEGRTGPDGPMTTAPGFGCVLQVLQNVVNVAISLAIVICVLWLAWAGALFMMSAASPGMREEGRTRIMNAIIGLVVILAAWLIVDFIMKALYNEGGKFGPWNSILAGDDGGRDRCIIAKNPNSLASGTVDILTGPPGIYTGGAAGGGANCPAGDPEDMVAFPASVTSGGGEKATATTVQNFLAMREAALKDGVDLKVTDGFRPESEQVSLWNKYCGSGTCGATKVAKPCSLGGGGSNHNSGAALDIEVGCGNGSTCNTKAYQWLKDNGARWNFRNDIPTDPVHWSPSGR